MSGETPLDLRVLPVQSVRETVHRSHGTISVRRRRASRPCTNASLPGLPVAVVPLLGGGVVQRSAPCPLWPAASTGAAAMIGGRAGRAAQALPSSSRGKKKEASVAPAWLASDADRRAQAGPAATSVKWTRTLRFPLCRGEGVFP